MLAREQQERESERSMTSCPQGHDVPVGSTFCPDCGERVPVASLVVDLSSTDAPPDTESGIAAEPAVSPASANVIAEPRVGLAAHPISGHRAAWIVGGVAAVLLVVLVVVVVSALRSDSPDSQAGSPAAAPVTATSATAVTSSTAAAPFADAGTEALIAEVASALGLDAPADDYPDYETLTDASDTIAIDVPTAWDDRLLDGGSRAALAAATELTDAASVIVVPETAPSGVSVQIAEQEGPGDVADTLASLGNVDSCSVDPGAMQMVSSTSATLDSGDIPAFIFKSCDGSGAGAVALFGSAADRRSNLEVLVHLNEERDLAALGHAVETLRLAGDALPLDEVYFSRCYFEGDPLEVEPEAALVGCDGGTTLSDLRWDEWTADGASGSGTYSATDCNPNCAAGTVTDYDVEVELSAPEDLACGRFFTAAVLRFPNGSPPDASGSTIEFADGELAPVC